MVRQEEHRSRWPFVTAVGESATGRSHKELERRGIGSAVTQMTAISTRGRCQRRTGDGLGGGVPEERMGRRRTPTRVRSRMPKNGSFWISTAMTGAFRIAPRGAERALKQRLGITRRNVWRRTGADDPGAEWVHDGLGDVPRYAACSTSCNSFG